MLEQGHRAPVINGPLLLPFRACPFRMMRPAAQGPSFILVQTASEDVAAGLERNFVLEIAPCMGPDHFVGSDIDLNDFDVPHNLLDPVFF